MDAERFSVRHDVLLCFAKNAEEMLFQRLGVESGEVPEHYDKVDETGRRYYLKPLRAMGGQGESRMARPNLHYSLVAPDGTAVWPKMKDGQDGTWRWSKEKTAREVKRIEWKQGSGGWTPYFRIYADSMKGIPPETIFYNSEVGSSRSAKAEIKAIFFGEEAFETPKPVALLERILEIGSTKDSIVLDSFAGSGTTAHAVLRTNANDGGERRFILVEGENYADRITAERVRRVIKGYAFSGTQREELLREKLTWTQLQKADALLAKVEAIRTKEGFVEEATQMNLGDAPSPRKRGDGDSTRRFDKIAVSVKDGELLVEGEKKTSERVAGLDGEFTFCILAEPLDPEGILSGKTLPDYESLGAWLYYAATGGTLDSAKIRASDYYLGPALDKHVWLIYKPDLAFLKSADAALTLTFARTLREKMPGKPHLVFAAAKFLSNRQLLEHGVEYAALPHSLYRGT